MKIVETCNFGLDYPEESFVNLPPLSRPSATLIAKAINDSFPSGYPRYWKVENDDYKLSEGFEV